MPRPLCLRLNLLGALAAVVACTSFADAATPLRIVTFNAEILTAPGVRAGTLQRFRFDVGRAQHIERVADLIETLTPDILNLVEVTSREAVDEVVRVLHEKGLTDYQGYHVESKDTFTGMDVAVITRLEPDVVEGVAIRNINSPADDPTWRQAYREASRSGGSRSRTTSISRNSLYYFTVAGHKLGFFGLHLISNPDSDTANAKRTAEATVAARAVRAEIVRRGYLPIVLGDLNDYDPDVPDRNDTRSTKTEVLRIIKDYDTASKGDELVSAAQWITRQSDRYTSLWDFNENGAPDPQDVRTMIDHVLLPKPLAPHVKRVFISRSVGLETSDHYPIVVDLELPEASTP